MVTLSQTITTYQPKMHFMDQFKWFDSKKLSSQCKKIRMRERDEKVSRSDVR